MKPFSDFMRGQFVVDICIVSVWTLLYVVIISILINIYWELLLWFVLFLSLQMFAFVTIKKILFKFELFLIY